MSDPVETRVGMSLYGDNAFFGRRISEMAGRTNYWTLVSLALGSRERSAEEAALLDDLCVCASAADPRVWPLKLTRIIASWGAPMAGLAAGALSAGEGHVGPGAASAAALWLSELEEARVLAPADRDPVGNAIQARRLPGFGVPLREVDERVLVTRRLVEQRHARLVGNYWGLSHEVERQLRLAGRRGLNMGGALAAILLDLSFTPPMIGPLVFVMLHPGFLAHAIEGAEQRRDVVRALPPNTTVYVGKPPRRSSR